MKKDREHKDQEEKEEEESKREIGEEEEDEDNKEEDAEDDDEEEKDAVTKHLEQLQAEQEMNDSSRTSATEPSSRRLSAATKKDSATAEPPAAVPAAAAEAAATAASQDAAAAKAGDMTKEKMPAQILRVRQVAAPKMETEETTEGTAEKKAAAVTAAAVVKSEQVKEMQQELQQLASLSPPPAAPKQQEQQYQQVAVGVIADSTQVEGEDFAESVSADSQSLPSHMDLLPENDDLVRATTGANIYTDGVTMDLPPVQPVRTRTPGAFHVRPFGFVEDDEETAMTTTEETAPPRREERIHICDPLEATLATDTNQTDSNELSDRSSRRFNNNNIGSSPTTINDQSSNNPSNNNNATSLLATFDIEPGVFEGTTVVDEEKGMSRRALWWAFGGIIVMVVIIIVMALGLAGAFQQNDGSTSPFEEDPIPSNNSAMVDASEGLPMVGTVKFSTLDKIKQRGALRCAFKYNHSPDEVDELVGVLKVHATLCRAVSAAIFGPSVEPYFVNMSIPDLFPSIADKSADVMIFGATHTMEREVYVANYNTSFSFSYPYLFTGIRAAGEPFYVGCMDNDFQHLEECRNLKICVGAKSTHVVAIERFVPQRSMVLVDIWPPTGFAQGLCNVFVEEDYLLDEAFIRLTGYQGNYSVGNNLFSKEPIAAVTSNDDPEFSSFVTAVIQGLFIAQKYNVSQENADSFPQTLVFGPDHKHMFRDAILVAGNFGEIQDLATKEKSTPSPLNLINDGSTPLLFSHPLGSIAEVSSNPRTDQQVGPILSSVRSRGFLRCGIRTVERPGFAEKMVNNTLASTYRGMEVDFCHAVAASLFQGDMMAVEFIEVETRSDGFALLSNGSFDILAGATWNLENDVREPTTGHGFAFSQPYFYGYSSEEDNLCLATTEDDHDWAAFVYWILSATIYADEQGISRETSNTMPTVQVFGPALLRMFRDAILEVGSYAEIYDRNLQALIPRHGRNKLNLFPNTGPQHYLYPDIIPQSLDDKPHWLHR